MLFCEGLRLLNSIMKTKDHTKQVMDKVFWKFKAVTKQYQDFEHLTEFCLIHLKMEICKPSETWSSTYCVS